MQNIERRYDIDWLRVIAIGLLVIYHVAIAFQPWGGMIGFITAKNFWTDVWFPMSMLKYLAYSSIILRFWYGRLFRPPEAYLESVIGRKKSKNFGSFYIWHICYCSHPYVHLAKPFQNEL